MVSVLRGLSCFKSPRLEEADGVEREEKGSHSRQGLVHTRTRKYGGKYRFEWGGGKPVSHTVTAGYKEDGRYKVPGQGCVYKGKNKY